MPNRAAQQLGRLGGLARSEAKARAARRNAKLGGWPKGRAATSRSGIMSKYTRLKNRINGERYIRISGTGEIVTEKDNPDRYAELRRLALNNERAQGRHAAMLSVGMVRVRGAMGGVYYE